MKLCPACGRSYSDQSLKFCRVDGSALVDRNADEVPTRSIGSTSAPTVRMQSSTLQRVQDSSADVRPETHYAKSGDVNIAYQVLGNGPIDLVWVPGWVTHIEYGWEQPIVAKFLRRLASFSRLILFDKRGTGLSDQTSDLPTLEQRMDDVRAVMEAVGSERAAVFGFSEGGNMAILFAATYPERTLALVTFGVFSKRVWDPDYPWAPKPEERQGFYDAIEREWGGPIGIEEIAPSVAQDPAFREWWGTYQRRSASPRAALALAHMNTLIDVREVLPAIRVPTLVMHRTDDRDANIEEGRYLAARIPGSTFIELAGSDHLVYVGDQESILGTVEKFLAELDQPQQVDTLLATVLCVQLAGQSSETAFERLRSIVQREAEWFKGRREDVKGGGLTAIFDGPVRAIRCACAISRTAEQAGIPTQIGLHTGLCEISGGSIKGAAVDICGQISGRAASGEVIISSSTHDLVSGSGITFQKKEMPGMEHVSEVFAVGCESTSVPR